MTGAAVIGVGMGVLYAVSAPAPTPERPKPPPPPEAHMNEVLRYSRTVYQGMIEQDAKALGTKAPTFDEMAQPFPYFDELKVKRRLRPNDAFDTPHLRIVLDVGKIRAVVEGQAFSSDHLLLKITNKTDKHLAYRVETRVPDPEKCGSKGDLIHNTIALKPNETITRSECLYRRDVAVDLVHVEVIEMPALAAYYVSRLPATAVLYEPRTSSGHVPLSGEPCPQTFSWREIREGMDAREIGWRDVIDFYARHNCVEYSFFRAYRYRSDPAASLPVKPLE
jgi:hypothetical protein